MAKEQVARRSASVTMLTEPLRMHYATRRVQRMWELGTVVVPAPIHATLAKHGLSLLDFEHMVTRGRVIDVATDKEDKKTRVYEVIGTTIEGHPARFAVHVRRSRGRIAQFTWMASRQPPGEQT